MKLSPLRLFGLLATFALSSPPAAIAAAVLHDWGNTTYDAATDLEWLDLSNTAGRSYTEVAGGWGGFTTDQGYRHATRDEVIALFQHAGMLSLATPAGAPVPENYAAAEFLLSLLDITLADIGDMDRSWMYFDPASDPSLPSPDHVPVAVIALGDLRSAYPHEGAFYAPGIYTGLSYSSSEMAHALVRVVPEPSTAAMAVSLLALLAVRRKRVSYKHAGAA